MRNVLDILEEIRATLKKQDLLAERKELDNEILASSTGSEITMRASSKLLSLQARNKQVDHSIGHLIKELIAYCNSVGLYPQKEE